MGNRRTEIPDLDLLVARWRQGETVTSLVKETGISRAVLDPQLKEAVLETGRSRVLKFLSECLDEVEYKHIYEAVGEKRLNLFTVLGILYARGLIEQRWVPFPDQRVCRIHRQECERGRTLYRLSGPGWATLKALGACEEEK